MCRASDQGEWERKKKHEKLKKKKKMCDGQQEEKKTGREKRKITGMKENTVLDKTEKY